MKEISVDSFTLFEYMFNHKGKDGIFTQPLLGTTTKLGLTSHDHARARYTSELKNSGLVLHQHRKGWRINETAMKSVTVFGMDATVAELVTTEKPSVDGPIDLVTPAVGDHSTYSGLDLAKAVATQLIERLEAQAVELATRPSEGVSEEEKARLLAHANNLEAAKNDLQSQLDTLNAQTTALTDSLRKEREKVAAADRKTELAQRELARVMREIADASGDDIKRAAERFLGQRA